MEIINIENFTFTYSGSRTSALENISLSINSGDFVTFCGKSGCGKSTLFRNLKPILAPYGEKTGKISFCGSDLCELSDVEQAYKIGFVLQNPDSQLVTDKVWHELAFGLESLGVPSDKIRIRVAETASFFGIQTLFREDVAALSGGQKQLLNLASVMVMRPEVLILDEPTSCLDPIAAEEFLKALKKINQELGTTILISEHRLGEVLPLSDKVIVMDGGRIIANGTPSGVASALWDMKHEMFFALPAPMRVYADVAGGTDYPLTVSEGRNWLKGEADGKQLRHIAESMSNPCADTAVELKNVWFKYQKDGDYVLRDLSLSAHFGELYAIVGGNGTGKTTSLSIMAQDNLPQRGKVRASKCRIALLPQNPQALFVKKTVGLDLADMLEKSDLTSDEREARLEEVISLCGLGGLKDRHPYDLSGGEQQRAALAKILLNEPKILLLDEPTKGLDAAFKAKFAQILNSLKSDGVCVIMVSHDIEFCAEHADRCALLFDGEITSEGSPREFFSGNSFYTTAANRMARGIVEGAVLTEDIITALGKTPTKISPSPPVTPRPPEAKDVPDSAEPQKNTPKIITSLVFGCLLFAFGYFFHNRYSDERQYLVWGIELLLLALSLNPFLPKKTLGEVGVPDTAPNGKLSKRTLLAAVFVLLAVPLTILAGTYLLENKKYYFISLLIILETTIPVFAAFEKRAPKARELVVISVLCAIAVAGRAAFYMLPQFKPVAAIVIIAGVSFGGEVGFLVGAVTGFVSNFFFGQGAWTPWQMFAFGMVGFFAGILFGKGVISRTRLSLCIYGGLSAVIIYGGIMNPSYILMSQPQPTLEMILSSYLLGLPFDLIHAVSTVFFLWLTAEPFMEKLDRIKVKYGFCNK